MIRLFSRGGLLARAWTSTTPRPQSVLTRHFMAEEKAEEEGVEKRQRTSRKKFKVVDEIRPEHTDKLAAAFAEMAKKEGFDSSTAYFADEDTFDDDFQDDDYDFDINNVEFAVGDSHGMNQDLEESSNFDLGDNTDDAIDAENDPLFFDDGDMHMAARIAAARSNENLGRVTVPSDIDELALNTEHSRELGFLPETPTEPVAKISLMSNAMTCSACGADFQSRDEHLPGFLPAEKFQEQKNLRTLEEFQNLQESARKDDWSPEDEVEWLLQQSSGTVGVEAEVEDVSAEAMAAELGIDLERAAEKQTICKRCHGLQNSGKVDETLRPGWSKEPSISQDKFLGLLRPLRDKNAIIVALVDLFDFSGSVLPNLDSIAGDNPVLVAANKVDLMPNQMGRNRVESWVRRELEYLGVKSLANMGGAVQLVSSKTGAGVRSLLAKARKLAEERDCDIYVVGAANAGKSTLLNHLLNRNEERNDQVKRKRRAGNANAQKMPVTTSPLPGTTLRFIKIDLGDGRCLYDTPGLLIGGALTQLLTPEELKVVVPKKPVEPITFRLESGKCVLIGGLAKVELVGESKAFLFTFFVSNDIKLHPTSSARALEFIQSHVGEMLTPPLPPGPERMEQLGEFEHHDLTIEGFGWKEAAADVALTGLGWVSVTGPGLAHVRVSVPKGIGVAVRPPLMPFDIWESTAKYTGSRSVRKTSGRSGGKKRKGVGRR